jgi:Zn-dependent peptidase ImmA (M78 family)
MQRSRNKTGPSKFPPNPKQWDAERNGHSIRDAFAKALHLPLEPFDIASRMPGVKLLTRSEVESYIGAKTAETLFNAQRDAWSGFTVPVEDLNLIVLNSTHPLTRQHASLTEELFHIRLRHKPCGISRCPVTGLMKREYSSIIETEAKHSAAAALVPYHTLREMLNSGGTIESIAEFLHVSVALVEMRMKVTRLLRRTKTP